MRFYTDFTMARLQLYKRGLYFGSYQTGTISRKIHMRRHKKGEKNEEISLRFHSNNHDRSSPGRLWIFRRQCRRSAFRHCARGFYARGTGSFVDTSGRFGF